MIRVRVPLEDFRALLLQDSGAAWNEAGAAREIRESASDPVKKTPWGVEANHAN
jgi:hypothetical protein